MYSAELKPSRKKTGLPATVQFLDPVTRSTSVVGIHVTDGMLKFGYEKKDELSRAGVDGKEVLGAEVPTLNAVVTLERLNVFDLFGVDSPMVLSIKPRVQSGRLVPLNERDGSLQPIIFRVKGYESSALVPLKTEDSSIEVGSAGVKVQLRAAQADGKGTLTVTKDGKKQFETDVEELLFGHTVGTEIFKYHVIIISII